MTCAQVMYQPYAPNPYVPDAAAIAGVGTTPLPPTSTPTGIVGVDQLAQQSLNTLHMNHHHHLHHHHQPPSVTTPQINHHQPQQQQPPPQPPQQQQQPPQQQSSQDPDPQSVVARGSYRTPSNESATEDSDGPPPEKKFCIEIESSETSTSSASMPPLQQQQQQQAHQHHHQHQFHHYSQHPHHQHSPTGSSSSPPQPHHQHQAHTSTEPGSQDGVTKNYHVETSVMVEEHFNRALGALLQRSPSPSNKGSSPAGPSPMVTRNFPESFWNSSYRAPSSRPPSLASHLSPSTELYDAYHTSLHSLPGTAPHDPWSYTLSSQAYNHRSVQEVYQAAMSSVPSTSRPYHQYPSLQFQPHLTRLPTMPPQVPVKPETWGARYPDSFTGGELAHGLDPNYTASHYSNVPGLESAVIPDTAKDLYWF